jgi:hypothetical protein
MKTENTRKNLSGVLISISWFIDLICLRLFGGLQLNSETFATRILPNPQCELKDFYWRLDVFDPTKIASNMKLVLLFEFVVNQCVTHRFGFKAKTDGVGKG